MTRKSKREIERTVENIENDLEAQRGGPSVVIVRAGTDLPDEYMVTEEGDEFVDSVETVATPTVLPESYRSSVVTLGTEDIVRLWDTMPEDTREREREYRREHDEPLPPVLEGDERGETNA